MSVFAASSFVYGGFSRWQLWFDNPNKAAVLFASLALISLAAAFRSFERGGIDGCNGRVSQSLLGCAKFAFFSNFAFMLLHTFSRGGMIAFGVGAVVVAGRKLWRYAMLLSMLVLLACIPAGRVAMGRLLDSDPGRDASAGNRLVLWQAVPRMMVEAPDGWGVGNSGAAFMSWYQPIERRETYRTLVGSHATWLVEFGRKGRMAYVIGWLFVLGACGVFCLRRKNGLPLALWLCLGTASFFSSVAEAWELWVLPLAAMVPVVPHIGGLRHLGAAMVCILGCAVVVVLEILGIRQAANADFRVRRDEAGGRTVLSAGRESCNPQAWIVYDAKVLGGAAFGRVLRARMKKLEGRAWGIADTLEAVPDDVGGLVLCGVSGSVDRTKLARFSCLKDLRVLSPAKPQDWLAAKIGGMPPHVFCGEFSAACPVDELPGLTIVPGARDYLPDWPQYAFGSLKGVH